MIDKSRWQYVCGFGCEFIHRLLGSISTIRNVQGGFEKKDPLIAKAGGRRAPILLCQKRQLTEPQIEKRKFRGLTLASAAMALMNFRCGRGDGTRKSSVVPPRGLQPKQIDWRATSLIVSGVRQVRKVPTALEQLVRRILGNRTPVHRD